MNKLTCAVFSLVASAFIATSSFAAQSAYDLMERANALYRDGKFKQAIMLYRKAESRGADPVATSFNIANSYYQQNDLPNAAATYRKAIDFSNGAFSPALFNMASVYFRLKQYPECVAAYHRALKLEPENVSGWLYLGEAYGKTGDAVGALRAIEKAYQLDKEDTPEIAFDEIVPLQIEPTDDPSVLGIKKVPNLRERKARLINKYSKEMPEYTDYEEVEDEE